MFHLKKFPEKISCITKFIKNKKQKSKKIFHEKKLQKKIPKNLFFRKEKIIQQKISIKQII